MTWFLAYDLATGAAKWAGECAAADLAAQVTAEIGVIPLPRRGTRYDEASERLLIDPTAALEALEAHVGYSPDHVAALHAAFPNLALMADHAALVAPLLPGPVE